MWGVAATRFSLVPGPENEAYLVQGYDMQFLVLIFAAICAFGLLIVAPLLHCTIGQKTFPAEYLAMDDHFFMNGNKWSGEFPDGFNGAEVELLEADNDEDEEE